MLIAKNWFYEMKNILTHWLKEEFCHNMKRREEREREREREREGVTSRVIYAIKCKSSAIWSTTSLPHSPAFIPLYNNAVETVPFAFGQCNRRMVKCRRCRVTIAIDYRRFLPQQREIRHERYFLGNRTTGVWLTSDDDDEHDR